MADLGCCLQSGSREPTRQWSPEPQEGGKPVDVQVFLSSAGHVPGWGYLFLFAVTATPLVPNGSVVMASAALAAQGHMSALLIALVVLSGTWSGDMALYGVVRWARPRVPNHRSQAFPSTLRGRIVPLLRRAEKHVHKSGTIVLITMRFIPGGRTTGAAAAGLGRYPAIRYAAAAAMAEASWTGLYVTIGYGGGKVAPGPLLAVGVAVFMGSVMGLVGLFLRRRRCWRAREGAQSTEAVSCAGSTRKAATSELAGRP